MTTSRQNELQNEIGGFIAGQIANAESPQAAKLAYAIKKAIVEFKEEGGENEGSFSVNSTYEDGDFEAEVDFKPNYNMTVMYEDEVETVSRLYALTWDEELCRLAGLMISEGWVEGDPQ
ncbi:hypothetical protein [Halomonas sp. Mc5H-6]|uniref:hypothetical protein n=1 Tax=Halomonas sp. Mc5H-6 TaxID=2954500 RepID=UPI002096F82B|nr:hypothetical protein [Halomonas sp. Mc5H-6]MCO7246381.1 hypothetical protein [Halomonas sp. Mc5H-6]